MASKNLIGGDGDLFQDTLTAFDWECWNKPQ